MVRLMLILLLAWQPLTLHMVGASATPGSDCNASECVVVVETDGCCPELVIEHRCGMTVDDCICGLDTGRPGEPIPAIPTTSPTPVVIAILPDEAVFSIDRPRSSITAHPGLTVRPFKSHNTNQAFLGVWRS
jgi:hypothetical protein